MTQTFFVCALLTAGGLYGQSATASVPRTPEGKPDFSAPRLDASTRSHRIQ